jgi:phage shock protein C
MRDRLYRSRGDRMLFGVAGGMARYLSLDPSLVRIVWALLVIAGGAGILLYIIAAIVIPEEPEGYVAPAASSGGLAGSVGVASTPGEAPSAAIAGRRDRGNAAVIIGVFLVVLGGWLLLQRYLPQIDADLVWPFALLALGGILVVGALRR